MVVLRDDDEDGSSRRARQEHEHVFFLSAVFDSTPAYGFTWVGNGSPLIRDHKAE
jgi:hypothetical protein